VGRIGPEQFQFFNSLPLLLLAVVGGLTSVTGALLGGLLLMLKDVLPGQSITAAGVLFVVIGVAAMSLGRNPNGLANLIFSFGRRLMPAWAAAPAPRGTTTGPAENAPVLDPLLDTGPLPVYAGFSREEVGLRASP
jgi:branched-chain amino acid transport system permease protein